MLNRTTVRRSSFLGTLAGLSLLHVPLFARASQTQYVCPPCGCASDGKLFGGPGPCPSCSMPLVARDALAQDRRVRLPNGASSVRFPFQLLANAIFIESRVNGRGPYLFAVDTGSYNSVLATEVTGELGIVAGTHFQAVGAGSDSSDAAAIASLTFTLPQGVDVSTNVGAMVSMAGLWPLIGQRFYGDIGHDILSRFVVELDYAKQLMTLHDPASYRYTGSGETFAAPFFAAYDPQVAGELLITRTKAISVRLTIDTGAGGTIVSAPLVRRYDLLRAVQRTYATQDAGIGGAKPTEVAARLSGLRIGRYTVPQPVVALSEDTAGSLADNAISVNLGGNILRRFTVIINYPGKTVTLEPNATLNDVSPYDASGLLLTATGPDFRTFVVDGVLPGSPAMAAGFERGDRILAIDGRDAGAYALWQFEDELKKSGAVVALTVSRGNETMVKTMRLESLI